MSIEDIHSLKKIREIKTKYGFSPDESTELEDKIIEKISQSADIIKKRIVGLNTEDEFFLLLLSIARVEQVTQLEQKQLVNSKKYTVPDFLVSVQVPAEMDEDSNKPKAQRMFIEVKKCKKDSYKFDISLQAYKKLRYFCQLYTLPLYFAVKFDTKQFKNWYLISGTILEKLGTKNIKDINGREQEAYSMDIGEFAKRDMSGLWFDNFTIILEEGTIITKVYDKNLTSNTAVIHSKYGGLKSHKVESKKDVYDIDLTAMSDSLRRIILSTLLRNMTHGEKNIQESENITIITYKAKHNIFIPFYTIILQSYLDIRQQIADINKEADKTPEFFINNFSDFDRNIIDYCHKYYNEILNKKIVRTVRMIPNFE